MKRSVSLFLVFIIIASIIPASAFANANVITIRTAEDLCSISRLFTLDSASRGKRIVLAADVDLTGVDFEPIPMLAGHFDGRGHTVSGLELDSAMSEVGLFRRVLEDGVITDLHVTGAVKPGDSMCSVGGIAGTNYGVIRESSFSGIVRGGRGIGGIAGVNHEQGLIEGCTASGAAEGQHRIGGISGENAGTVRGCVNNGNINQNAADEFAKKTPDIGLKSFDLTLSAEELVDITDIGGIVGYSSGVVRNCENNGKIGHKVIGYNVGGVIGHLAGYVEGCVNSGVVRGRKDVGGIVGQVDPDGTWSFPPDKLDELDSRLEKLRSDILALSDELSGKSAGLSNELSDAFAAISDASDAASELSDDAVRFINGNIGAVNTLSSRAHESAAALASVFESLITFTDGFAASVDSFSAAFDKLSEAAALSDGIADKVGKNMQNAINAIGEARSALDELTGLLSGYLQEPDGDLSALIGAVLEKLRMIRMAFSSAAQYISAAGNALLGIGDVGEPLIEAMEALETASSTLSASLKHLSTAEQLAADLLDTLAGYETVVFTPINDNTAARTKLFGSIGRAAGSLKNASAYLGDDAVRADFDAVVNSLFDLMGFITDSIRGIEKYTDKEMIMDDSASDSLRRKGRVVGCSAVGSVEAETNAGGIIGAITLDISFDLEDSFRISSLISGPAKYVIYASAVDCVSEASVSARKDCAGGVVGRMDYGFVSASKASGDISAAEYAGGIAGYSSGSIAGCFSRNNLAADKYLGGIAGWGHTIVNCLSLPSPSAASEYCGAIAGDADGDIEGNCYSDCSVGGINGFSFAGRAEEISHAEMLEKSGASDNDSLFGKVDVVFVSEDELFALAIPFGGTVEVLPSVPDKDGRIWKWDEFNNNSIVRSLTIHGAYYAPLTVLSSGGEHPELLAEGRFVEGMRLEVTDRESALERAFLSKTVTVPGYSGKLTLRVKAEGKPVLYTEENGVSTEIDYSRDGSYIVFPLDNGGSFTLVERRIDVLKPIITIAAIAAAAVCCTVLIVLLIRKRKRFRNTSRTQA